MRTSPLVVVGLGNPGKEYEGTRHNVGADVVSLLARRRSLELKPEKGTFSRLVVSRGDDIDLVLGVPATYMNDSGLAASALVKRYELADLAMLVVVHDELDLAVGTVRVKLGGGTAGHNGLRSIQAHLHSLHFSRVRIGIGKPPGSGPGVSHVLGRPSKSESAAIEVAIELAADAVEAIASKGIESAMNEVNTKSKADSR